MPYPSSSYTREEIHSIIERACGEEGFSSETKGKNGKNPDLPHRRSGFFLRRLGACLS